jgi:hypothetical protein
LDKSSSRSAIVLHFAYNWYDGKNLLLSLNPFELTILSVGIEDVELYAKALLIDVVVRRSSIVVVIKAQKEGVDLFYFVY